MFSGKKPKKKNCAKIKCVQVKNVTPCHSPCCQRVAYAKKKKKNVHWKANIATWIMMANNTHTTCSTSTCDECCCSDLDTTDYDESSQTTSGSCDSFFDQTESELAALESSDDGSSPHLNLSEKFPAFIEASDEDSGDFEYTKYESLDEPQDHAELTMSFSLPTSKAVPVEEAPFDFLTFPYIMRTKGSNDKMLVDQSNSVFKPVKCPPETSSLRGTAKVHALPGDLTQLKSPIVTLLPKDDLDATKLLASRVGDFDYIEEMKGKSQLDPYVQDKVGATCLHYAARGGHIRILRFFIDQCQCRIVPRSFVGATPLHDAAALGHLETVKYLSEQWQEAIGMKDNEKSSVLHVAARYGRLSVLRWLLTETGMPSADRSSGGALALHYAAARGCLQCVKLLLEASDEFSANAQMENAVTPVYLAAQEGHVEVLQYLVEEAGGKLLLKAKDGMAPLHAAAQMGCLSCLKWMIKTKGVDVNLRDGDGATPLHFAASRGHKDCVTWLLRNKASIALDNFGKSPINDAADNNHIEVLQLLIQRGADSAGESDSSDCGSSKKSCSCNNRSDKMRKESNCSSSASCSSCRIECQSRSSSDSGVHQEPFYLHTTHKSKEDRIFSKKSQKSPSKSEKSSKKNEIIDTNPLAELKEASERHSQIRKESNASSEKEPFYLHNPDEVIYHRVQELFNERKGSIHEKRKDSSEPSSPSSRRIPEAPPLPPAVRKNAKIHEDSYVHSPDQGWTESSNDSRNSEESGSDMSSSDEQLYEDIPNNSKGIYEQIKVLEEPYNAEEEDDYQKQKKLLQGLDDLIAGVPAPDYETNDLLEDVSTKTDVPVSTLHNWSSASFPPPSGYDDGFSSENENENEQQFTTTQNPPSPPPLPKSLLKSTTSSNSEYSSYSAVSMPTVPSKVENGRDTSTETKNSPTSKRTLERSSSLPSQESDKQTENKRNIFTPPQFPIPGQTLIKPSEYLRSLTGSVDSLALSNLPSIPETGEDESRNIPPPPPPQPSPTSNVPTTSHPVNTTPTPPKGVTNGKIIMPSISVTDLQSVQLRKTETKVVKTTSVPLAINGDISAQKNDVIAELKMSVDIDGIKKLKNEKYKEEISHEQKQREDLKKQFVSDNFVEKVPEVDSSGNRIPDWKRQMLARKAAEKAQKEAEERRIKEAEEKRLKNIPEWKRHLLAKKEEEKQRNVMRLPTKIENIPRIKVAYMEHQQTTTDKSQLPSWRIKSQTKDIIIVDRN